MSEKAEKKKIDSLTDAQKAMIPKYVEEYRKIGLDTHTDRPKAEEAVKRSYKYLKLETPEIFWRESPYEGAKLAAQMAKGDENVTDEEIRAQATELSYGSFEAYWVSFYAFIAEQLPVEKDELIDIVKDIVKNCGAYWSFHGAVVLTPKPIAIHMKDQKLHNPDGLALEYPDGRGIFALEGVQHPSLLDLEIQKAAATT